jgi:hypothetical protein
MELQLPSDLQMLVMSRPLMEALERETFDRFTESNQTQIEVSTPEEMRWLAMYPKVPLELSKAAKAHFGSVAVNPKTAAAWIDASVAEQLAQAAKTLLRESPPFVLMTLRGRVYLRCSSTTRTPPRWRRRSPCSRPARRPRCVSAAAWPTAMSAGRRPASSAWQTQLNPEDPKAPGN